MTPDENPKYSSGVFCSNRFRVISNLTLLGLSDQLFVCLPKRSFFGMLETCPEFGAIFFHLRFGKNHLCLTRRRRAGWGILRQELGLSPDVY